MDEFKLQFNADIFWLIECFSAEPLSIPRRIACTLVMILQDQQWWLERGDTDKFSPCFKYTVQEHKKVSNRSKFEIHLRYEHHNGKFPKIIWEGTKTLYVIYFHTNTICANFYSTINAKTVSFVLKSLFSMANLLVLML